MDKIRKTIKIAVVITVILVLMAFSVSIIQRNTEAKQSTGSTEAKEIEDNDKAGTLYSGPTMWQDLLECDSESAEALANDFSECTGSEADTLTYELIKQEDKDVLRIKATVGDKNYYVKTSSNSTITEIREGTPDGKIVMQVIY